MSGHRLQRLLCAATAALAGGLLCACGGDRAQPQQASSALVSQVAAATTSMSVTPGRARITAVPDAGATAAPTAVSPARADAGRRGGVDHIRVDKCWTNATASSGGQLLISADSSDRQARLLAYRQDGTLIGEVQNGGGQRYGGTVFAYEPTDPLTVTIMSSSGGRVTVATTPFRPEN
ncbi:hypothetical protein FHX52_4310 [Humibacillus xanthopallidus]|uniref:Lipoprotein n=1 Tax=Humibacillus xanthopallidus TaxID=412689 RepID=A0A543PLY5_9MICO|nr:hypothetical protein [Humibacillus xanthopallidus]TQN45078.1 hypothetical protein FHX52_4310 [Humibacillus xanthopallidus]